jgi:hypothetical protein
MKKCPFGFGELSTAPIVLCPCFRSLSLKKEKLQTTLICTLKEKSLHNRAEEQKSRGETNRKNQVYY